MYLTELPLVFDISTALLTCKMVTEHYITML